VQPIIAGPGAMRPWREGDEHALAAAANHRAIWLALRDRFPHPYTIADAEAWLALNLADPDPVNLAIEVDGVVAGGIGLIRQSDVHRISAELGYWLTPACWGRGIMTAAVGGFTEWAFATHGLERIFAVTFDSNPASARVLEKAGYTLEGVLRNSVLKDGHLMDSRLYARLRT
jgi:ribosomal-protein-alanine N-acetyltransferase